MVRQVAGDERDVQVPGLANRFAGVEALDVRQARLGDARQPGSRGGVDDVEPRVARSFGPASADEKSERPVLPGDPLERRLIALGRGAVRHRLEYLADGRHRDSLWLTTWGLRLAFIP